MISSSGATLGVPKVCEIAATFNDGIAAFLGLSDQEQEYHYYFWESQTAGLRGLNQGAAQPNRNTGILSEMPIPVCHEEEMAEVVGRLSAMMSQVDAMESEITTALAKITALRQSILKQAFSGHFVPQDSDDEPASALLARLRDAAPAPRTRRKTKA
jgi:type I restriction enzyme S subunit